jgi:hypothetical protein
MLEIWIKYYQAKNQPTIQNFKNFYAAKVALIDMKM